MARMDSTSTDAEDSVCTAPPGLPLRGEEDAVDEEHRADEVVHAQAAEAKPGGEGDEPQHRDGLYYGEEGRDVRLHHPEVDHLLVHPPTPPMLPRTAPPALLPVAILPIDPTYIVCPVNERRGHPRASGPLGPGRPARHGK
eukprot:161068-Hanusia_phi.AAC.1